MQLPCVTFVTVTIAASVTTAAMVIAAVATTPSNLAIFFRRGRKRKRPTALLRDLRGYANSPPALHWPSGARLAINFVINVEEGSEPNVGDGDVGSTAALCECPSDAPAGVRDLAAESMFEYGSRVGIWRVLRGFEDCGIPATIFACALALERLPEVAAAIRKGVAAGLLDVCCHGYRWEDHMDMKEGEERQRIEKAVASLSHTLGRPPEGWYCRTAPSENTRRLLVAHGGFLYDSDSYNDELPYWAPVELEDGRIVQQLVLPYTLCTNDSKFAPGRAFSTGDDFFNFCREAIDVLLEEVADTGQGRMLSIGLHPRLIGHPARMGGLNRLLKYVASLGSHQAWLARRIDIARFWRVRYPPPSLCPSSSPITRREAQAQPCDRVSPPTAQRLLVTGGSGFFLSHVVLQWLRRFSDASCVIFDKMVPEDESLACLLSPFLESGRLAIFSGDVADHCSWTRFSNVHGTGFTHVVAGAALTPTTSEEAELGLDVPRVNLLGVLRAFEFARSCTQLHRFLFVSSNAILSAPPLGGPAHSRPAVPAMPSYTLSKLVAEAQLQRWAQLYPNINAVTVRLSDVWGAMDRDTGARNRHNAPYWVIRRALRHEAVEFEADSLDRIGFDYIDAPSAALGVVAILSLTSRPKRSVYEIALGRGVSHLELLAAVCARPFGEPPDADIPAEFARRFAPVRLVAAGDSEALGAHVIRSLPEDHWLHSCPMDISPMREEFGWEPTPLPEAVSEYMAWLEGSSFAPPSPHASVDTANTVTPELAPNLAGSAAPRGHAPSLLGLTMVVTGGASGIGRGIVLKAAAQGCHVVYIDVRDTPLEGGETSAAAAKGCLGQVDFVCGDVTSKADLERAASTLLEKWGRIDVWVNNAAVDLTDPPQCLQQRLTTTTLEQFEQVQRVNTTGFFLGAQVAVECFLQQGPRAETGLRGKLINIGSQHGMVACPGNLPYGITKAAANYMTKQIAVDYANDLIACNGVAPGKIIKDPLRPVSPYSYARTPCNRLGTPTDVANAVCWLACDDAAAYLTGHILQVDGGWMAF